MTRPFRFGLQASFASSHAELRDTARRAEDAGYDVLSIADHLGIIDPFIGCTAAAAATERIRIGTNVLNIDFHPVGQLARSAATADLMSDGRFELGLGAGHMQAEYDAAGLRFDRPGRRITRLEESIGILRSLFSGETVSFEGQERSVLDHSLSPLPPQGADLPIMVGGNGDRLLTVAATLADIVGFVGFTVADNKPALTHMTPEGLDDRIAMVEAVGRDVERQALVQRVIVTDDAQGVAEDLAAEMPFEEPSADVVRSSPFLLIGSVDAICDQLRERRDRFGISYWVFFSNRASPEIDQVVSRLAGT